MEARTSNSGITANLSEAQPAGSVHLETSNGGVELTLPANFASGARVRTSNGQIRLLMPNGANARVVAHTNNSAISSEFEMKVLGEVGRNNLDAVIGAGAVVREDVAPRAVAVGVPARVVSTRPS